MFQRSPWFPLLFSFPFISERNFKWLLFQTDFLHLSFEVNFWFGLFLLYWLHLHKGDFEAAVKSQIEMICPSLFLKQPLPACWSLIAPVRQCCLLLLMPFTCIHIAQLNIGFCSLCISQNLLRGNNRKSFFLIFLKTG